MFIYGRFAITILCTGSLLLHPSGWSESLSTFDPFEFHDPYEREPPEDEEFVPYDSLLPDLEAKAQDFVLELKRIHIPGCPGAFNPSLTRWKGSLLMSFRARNSRTGSVNKIGLVWLDKNFNLVSEPTLLEMRVEDPLAFSREQDPRLITVGERLYVVYSNAKPGILDREVRRMFFAEVHFDGKNFYLENPECISSFEGENIDRWQKNWVPFVYKDQLLLAHSLLPHFILRPLEGTSSCETIASTRGQIKWHWGVLRGGTPALEHEGEYLAFFHSCKDMTTANSRGKHMVHYFMGAYTFSLEPPFAITRVSPTPIVGKGFYHGHAYKTWKPLRVVFPMGFVFDEDYIWVTYGRQDHEVWVVKLDKKGLFKSLVPVKTIE